MKVELNKPNEELLNIARPALKVLKTHLMTAHVAGGFCRDCILGVSAKDLDIVVYDWHTNDKAEELLHNKAFRELVLLGFTIHEFDTYEDAIDDDFTKRQIRRVWKLNKDGRNIDIIFIEDCHPNPEGIYANFNLGQRRNSLASVLHDFDFLIS